MYKFILTVFLVILSTACTGNGNENVTVVNETEQPNTLTQKEMEEGWELLFDGERADHWRGYNSDTFPQTGWSVSNGALVFKPVERDGAEGGQNIITKKKFENFHLKLEWKIEEGSNSGIFYGVFEQEDKDIYWSGPEYQIIDDNIFSEMNPQTEKRLSGALYDLVPAEPQNTRPVGEWNSSEIIINAASAIHRQNGETVLEAERWTPEWFEMIRESKFECHNEFGNVRKGHIGIQDHGGPVMIRNIKIKEFD